MNLTALPEPLRPLPAWSPIGLDDPQTLIDVSFAAGGRQRDVTNSNVVLSLVPLMVGIGIEGGVAPRHSPHAELVFRDHAGSRQLGVLRLTPAGTLHSQNAPLHCYSVDASHHDCLPWPSRAWQQLLQLRRGPRRDGMPMSAAQLRHLQVFYICPRPVVLVSVADAGHENLFPMDLIGDIGGGLFTLALRNTSPSVATLARSRRAAFADVLVQQRELAYSLGAHHRLARIDWSSLACETRRSPHHGLRVPAHAPRVRDIDILDVQRHGSHTVFLSRVVCDEHRTNPRRLFHTSGIHRAWRDRQGSLPWQEASA